MFYENFLKLCADRNIAPSAVLISLGMSKGSVTHWKNGKTPHDSTVAKIAEYFGVTVDDLTGNASTVSRTDLFAGASPFKHERVEEIVDQVINDLQQQIEKAMEAMSEEELQEFSRYADYLINRKK